MKKFLLFLGFFFPFFVSAEIPEHVQKVSDKFAYLQELSRRPFCEDTFHVVDVGLLAERLQLWKNHLPKIKPYYAVKTNNDKVITSVLSTLGTGFDCASEDEIEEILNLGVDPSRIIFAHPRKPVSSILYAKNRGIDLFTFDSLEEMDKLSELYPEARLLLRIKTDDSKSANPLSRKFGATLRESLQILDAGLSRKVNIVGVAFHVGSNCLDPDSYLKALFDAAHLFLYSKNRWDTAFSLLDLGGGWPGTHDEIFIEIADCINDFLEAHFDPDVQLIAEPGRYFAAQTTTLCMRIIGKKESEEDTMSYYLSNGVYGFFLNSLYYAHDANQILTEGWKFRPLQERSTSSLYPSLLWGATCDSQDRILEDILLPEMESGDFLVVENLGAYTRSLQTSFNGITLSKPYYIYETPMGR